MFLKMSFGLSALMLLLQVIFQVVLISLKNYGQIIHQSCKFVDVDVDKKSFHVLSFYIEC